MASGGKRLSAPDGVDGCAELDDPRLSQRFWAKVAPEPMSGCWLWTAAVQRNGYGSYWDGGRVALAHRVAYEALVGAIGVGLQSDHLCRVRCCVNPAHIEPVPPAVNTRRGLAGAVNGGRKRSLTRCPAGHLYSGENVGRDKRGYRYCLTCKRTQRKALYAKMAEEQRAKARAYYAVHREERKAAARRYRAQLAGRAP